MEVPSPDAPACPDEKRVPATTAFDRLVPLVYDALTPLARKQLRRHACGHALEAADLVHETYLKMARQAPIVWTGRSHFYGVAVRAMRQVLVDVARRRGTARRGGGYPSASLSGHERNGEAPAGDRLAVVQALERLGAVSARLRTVVELRFFGGMTEEEIAKVLAVSTRTVERDWIKARLFLRQTLSWERPAAGPEP